MKLFLVYLGALVCIFAKSNSLLLPSDGETALIYRAPRKNVELTEYIRSLAKSILARPDPAKIAMATEFVKAAIAKDKVVIFSKSYCPYCKVAKEQFNKLNQRFSAIELENRDDCAEIQAALGKLTGATSMPRVFVNGNFIGGGTDVKKMYESGKLKRLLN